jgi:hypothetical protein
MKHVINYIQAAEFFLRNWPLLGSSENAPGKFINIRRKITKNLNIVSVPTDVQTRHLPDTNEMHCRLSQFALHEYKILAT